MITPLGCRGLLLALAFGLTWTQMPAGAADGPRAPDQERARAARALDKVLPLMQILRLVDRDFHGRVIEVELEMEDGQQVYEIELLLRDGRLIEVEFDARSGELLKVKGNRLETVFKPRPGPPAERR